MAKFPIIIILFSFGSISASVHSSYRFSIPSLLIGAKVLLIKFSFFLTRQLQMSVVAMNWIDLISLLVSSLCSLMFFLVQSQLIKIFRLDASLQQMLREMKALFGEDLWKHVVIGVSFWSFSEATVQVQNKACSRQISRLGQDVPLKTRFKYQ